MSSSLSDEFEREVYPWLQLAEDLRLLRLDVEASMWSYYSPSTPLYVN